MSRSSLGLPPGDGSGQHPHQVVDLHRLHEVVEGAEAAAVRRVLGRAVTGKEHHGYVGPFRLDGSYQGQPAEPRHLHIREHHVKGFLSEAGERRGAVRNSARDEAAKALVDLLNRPESRDCVLALPPSGLMGGYLRAIKKANGTTVVVTDQPENILDRIRFFDIDSRPIKKKLTPREKKLYLREIKKDITYYRTSYQRANLQVDISGLDAEIAARKVKDAVKELDGKVMQQVKSEQKR